MTYFNQHIYNRENLKEADRQELDYFYNKFIDSITNAYDNLYNLEYESDTFILDKICSEIVQQYINELKKCIGYSFNDDVVDMIDNYDDDYDVKERETYTTYIRKDD